MAGAMGMSVAVSVVPMVVVVAVAVPVVVVVVVVAFRLGRHGSGSRGAGHAFLNSLSRRIGGRGRERRFAVAIARQSGSAPGRAPAAEGETGMVFDGVPPKAAALDRRGLLCGLSALGAALALPAAAAEDALMALEARSGGRLGVFALDTGSGRSLAHRANERFLMCSTSKFGSVSALLARVDAGAERLDRRVAFTAADTDVGYAPDTKAHLAAGGMSLGDLCAAAIVHSDNGAANLILNGLGGPAAVTRFVRGLGDDTTRFDRTEPTLNHADRDRDTTTPRAYAGTLRAVLLGAALKPASRNLLEGWMVACTTGRARLRAGVPASWTAADKTGTAGPNAGDIALFRPPGRAPLVVAAFCDAPRLSDAEREAVLKAVGESVAAAPA